MNLFGPQNRDQNFDNCWKQLPFGYKFLFVTSIGYNALSLLISSLFTTFAFSGYMVAHQIQIWRFLIPFFPAGQMPMAIFNILINFLWLLSIYPALEKKFSTSYILIQTILQNFLINVILAVVAILCFDIFSVNPQSFDLLNFGFFPLCLIFIWYRASQSPDQHTTFCCMPCLIPMKWIPVIILIFCVIFSSMLLPALLVASLVGYLQFMYFKRRFIKLPLKFYRKIDTLLPKLVTDRNDYVKVQNVQSDLQSQCYIGGVNAGGGANPFNRNQNIVEQNSEPNKVEVIGKGVSIGGGSHSNAQNFKGFWAKKAEQIQIEPVPVKNPFQIPVKNLFQKKEQKQGIDHNLFNTSNDSNIQFNQLNSDERSEQEFEQKDEKKIAKQNLLE